MNAAAAAGYFKTRENLESLKKDEALDSLRNRTDFMQLLEKLGASP